MKIIISTGLGRLHLIDSAVSLKHKGMNVKVITGWVPTKGLPDFVIDFLGLLIGRRKLSYGLRRRSDNSLLYTDFVSLWFPEFFNGLLTIFTRLGFISNRYSSAIGWYIFGVSSRKYVRNADILHIRSAAGAGGVIKYAKAHGLVVIVDHSIAHPIELFSQLNKVYSKSEVPVDPNFGLWKFVQEDCNNADVLLVNSNYVKNTFIQKGFPESKIEILNLGVRHDFYDLKKSYKIENNLTILFSGTINRRKGIGLIIEAAYILLGMKVKFKFSLVGQIAESMVPDELISKGFVELIGHVPQDKLKEFFIKSDIYVFPSYCEGSAQSLKEAMASGLPVIATVQSGGPIVNEVNGLLLNEHCPNILAHAILRLYDDEELRIRLGRNAVSEIKNNHTWEKYAEGLIELYHCALDKKHVID